METHIILKKTYVNRSAEMGVNKNNHQTTTQTYQIYMTYLDIQYPNHSQNIGRNPTPDSKSPDQITQHWRGLVFRQNDAFVKQKAVTDQLRSYNDNLGAHSMATCKTEKYDGPKKCSTKTEWKFRAENWPGPKSMFPRKIQHTRSEAHPRAIPWKPAMKGIPFIACW